ncbi:DNA phosphorothioation-associated DGQHR protein 1 [Aureisphaera sp. CAU 1614]|uniref:DNA phosphorothioation-associated DGQHR protein 1 n=1 Tax=Halomarinibacterium sedimenti TaxID=2857106 RepID=A0A9X1JZ68_9FLAO|nr:DNA phosphorothioation-associated DGQHR protein 1 [Halomarinibacterium sedimenti]MBW2938237.1 DNA phosphorothioation-associated DGQHR protein 1 [Halomarinibacterium sedimenti]
MSFLKLKAIKIDQPLASFYITKIKAKDLLEISFSEELQYIDESGKLKGNQRKKDEKRLKSIGRYIDSIEMSFPNSIIIAANYDKNRGQIIDNKDRRWKLTKSNDDFYEIDIPTNEKLASIIDGQHRLNAFDYVTNQERKELDLVCTIFFDLSSSYQAFLFATINGNQKKVDKSLALEQFGFNIDDEPSKSWTPEKFAVYYCRKLNFKESPFKGKIKLAPKFTNDLFDINSDDFIISTATIVDGILMLISSRPKRDRVEMGQHSIFKGRGRYLIKDFRDSSPLRNLYLNNEDEKIYEIIKSFFGSVEINLWNNIQGNSYIIKTVGIQALFEFLKKILQLNTNYSNIDFDDYLNPVSGVNFADNYFQASGVGKSRIKRVLFVANDFMSIDDVKENEQSDIVRLLS